jgi:Na+/H+-translocating membrane pyrophosphatase
MALLYFSLGAGVLALFFAAVTAHRVLREDAGTERMRAIAALIQAGGVRSAVSVSRREADVLRLGGRGGGKELMT